MTLQVIPAVDEQLLADMLVHYEVERFYTLEAGLLDEHRYSEWVNLFTDDIHYFMPIRRTMSRRELDKEFTQPGDIAYFDDDKRILNGRVLKLASGTAWAEDPPSRTRRLITNIRILANDASELTVTCNFMLYRTRLKSEEDHWIGRREDILRRTDEGLRVARRYIYLDQTVLLSANLSNFF
jgi:3-phenylpropionate/cinnamic acid dioxygenase small subunit